MYNTGSFAELPARIVKKAPPERAPTFAQLAVHWEAPARGASPQAQTGAGPSAR